MIESVPALTFLEARARVVSTVRGAARMCGVEEAALAEAAGRVLAEDIAADRDMPAVARAVRDGYAVRAEDLPGELRIVGEVRAGERFGGKAGRGDAVEIMTGAPVPEGCDAVVMVEHAESAGDRVRIAGRAESGQFINPRGCEARAGEIVLRAGTRLDYTGVAALAAVGRETVTVVRKPSVAILATGDEIVEIGAAPEDYQIRNSNAQSLAAQVARAGGVPVTLAPARDDETQTRAAMEKGLEADLLLISGGVSAGKYDLVERALAALGAEFYFDRVLIQPGQPAVFGHTRGKFFFGLPGNPASTMVTFEIFARAALELIGGQGDATLDMPYARLTREFRHRAGITRFLPARFEGGEVTPIAWSGSGDIPAMTRANVYLVAQADRPEYAPGDLIQVLRK